MWLVPALLGAVVGVVIGIIVSLFAGPLWLVAGLLLVIGAVVGALIGYTTVAKSDHWLRAAVGLDRAQLCTPDDQPRLHNLLESLCLTAGVDLEGVFVLDSPQANLLALGANSRSATLLVTRGLVERFERFETEALLALAVGQIRDEQTAERTLLLLTVGLPSVLAETAHSALVRLAAKPAVWFTRRRLADLQADIDDIATDVTAAGITRYPPGLVAAFERASQVGTNVGASATLAPLWLLAPDADSAGRASLQFRIQVLHEL